jgi:hypothetical protein
MSNSFFISSNHHLQIVFSSSLSSSSAYSSGFESALDSADFIYECDAARSGVNTNKEEQQDCLMESDPSSIGGGLTSQQLFDFDYYYYEKQSNTNCELWQFLLELLEDKRSRNVIRWVSVLSASSATSTSQPSSTTQSQQTTPSLVVPLHHQIQKTVSSHLNDNEFVILDPIEVARRWAIRRDKPSMTYKRFNRILRSYYNKKKILHKTAGKANVFAFQINIQPYLSQIRCNQQRIQEHVSMKHLH